MPYCKNMSLQSQVLRIDISPLTPALFREGRGTLGAFVPAGDRMIRGNSVSDRGDPSDLNRFLSAHEEIYDRALA